MTNYKREDIIMIFAELFDEVLVPIDISDQDLANFNRLADWLADTEESEHD
jgi:hypothetical protein